MISDSQRTIRVPTCTPVAYFACIFIYGIPLISAVTREVQKQLRQHHIIPDVIDVVPTSIIEVQHQEMTVKVADLLEIDQVATKPSVHWPAASDSLYTLIMTDADYPSPHLPNRTEFIHWMVINIKGPQLDLSNAESKIEYLSPMENSTAGLHRYVFTAFRQKNLEKIDDFPPLSTEHLAERANFNTVAFVEKHQFGYPVAVNFYQIEFKN